MKIETVMWLLVVVFMFHDFEEIIMMAAWRDRSQELLGRLSASTAGHALFGHVRRLSTASFAFAVFWMFLLVAGCVFVSVQFSLYSFWAAVLVLFFIHLCVHIGQWLVVRKYVPVIWTSLLSCIYCGYAFWVLNASVQVRWVEVVWLAVLSCGLLAAYLVGAIQLALRFEGWLQRFSRG